MGGMAPKDPGAGKALLELGFIPEAPELGIPIFCIMGFPGPPLNPGLLTKLGS